jgi:hypothetical protein
MPPLSRSSDNAQTAANNDVVVVVDVVVVSVATSPSAPWTISPPPPPPSLPSDTVRKDHVRGDDVNDDHDGSLIIAVVMSGWLRKQTRQGKWVRWWFVLNSSGGVHYSRHPPPPLGSSSGLKLPSRQGRANRVITLVGGGGTCHPLWTIPLVERVL